jgi:hypothetical protein
VGAVTVIAARPEAHSLRRRVLLVCAAVALTLAADLLAVPARAAAAVASVQKVATLQATHAVYNAPNGQRIGSVSRSRPITGEATSLPVLATRQETNAVWLDVRLPGRPNGHSGWIKASGTRVWLDHWHIVIVLHQRTAHIYFYGRQIRHYLVVVGKPSTPTPTGEFFVEENIAEPSSFPGAPYALATSARSNVLHEFDQGPGQVALHGVGGGLGGTPGQAQSHGCVRFTTAAITWLAHRIVPGTPVTIKP